MSAHPQAVPDHGHGHDHGQDHGHHDDDGAAHGSLKGYVAGFLLSVVLTAIPFWLVMDGTLGNPQLTGFAVMGFAVVQIVVHMVFFLHMNTRSEAGWNMLALVFTAVLVVIMLAGSLWVMYHLNANMMPSMPHDMRQMP